MSLAATGVLFAAAITPGPNNLVVMDVAGRGRLRAVAAPIAGIVAGTAALVVTVWFGLDTLVDRWPISEGILRIAGAGLLAFLAFRIARSEWSREGGLYAAPPRHGHLFPAMLFPQVVNPKTWVLAVAVVAAHGAAPLLGLLALVAVVPPACLLVWAVAGRALATALSCPDAIKGFAVAMGAILMAFAVMVLIGDA